MVQRSGRGRAGTVWVAYVCVRNRDERGGARGPPKRIFAWAEWFYYPQFHGGEDKRLEHRPPPPREWIAHVYAADYGVTPLTAWYELGYPLVSTRRERGRITTAARELSLYNNAIQEVTKKGRDLEKDPPRVEDVVMMNYIRELMLSRVELVDDPEDGFTPDDAPDDAPSDAPVNEGTELA